MPMSLKPRYFDGHCPRQRLAVAVLVRAVKDTRVVEKRMPERRNVVPASSWLTKGCAIRSQCLTSQPMCGQCVTRSRSV